MASSELERINRYLPISATLGTAGQPNQFQFSALQDAGYETIINLAMPDSQGALSDEQELVTARGMDYVAIPVVWNAPKASDLEKFFTAMEQYAGKKCLVHCIANMRVAAFVYLYRVIKAGVPPVEAQVKMHEIWEPNPTWAQFIDEALQRYGV